MLFLFLFVCVLFSKSIAIDSHCEKSPLCHLNDESTIIVCDTTFDKHNESNIGLILSCFPSVNIYSFRNFRQIQANIFQNLTFKENQTYSIQLINVSMINSETFSTSIKLPKNSNLSIDIEHANDTSRLILKPNTFSHIRIDRLRFLNVNSFNRRSIFETNSFGSDLQINELIFDQCSLTGFTNSIRRAANINYLSIINSPDLTQLTNQNLPLFLSTIKSLQISNTGLQIIDANTFEAWSLVLEELIISNNSKLENFPSNIVAGVLMKLNKLDLSYNSIKVLDQNYNWFAYSYAKELLLKNQQLDLFLKSNILKTLPYLEKIDLSAGFISENNNDLFKNSFGNLSNLISIDISYTNITENMIIDLLAHLSQTANHFINISLYGHTLTNENFCSYFTIFKNAPNLLNLQLDDTHECNCVVDLFYMNDLQQDTTNSSVVQPSCLSNTIRTPCDIQTQLSTSKCQQSSDQSNSKNNNIGDYAFGGVVGGLAILVMILLSLGFTVVYQIRRRRNTDLSMDQPVENPLDVVIEERLQGT